MSLINKAEAPVGFCAKEKPLFSQFNQSICRACDWREQCCDPSTDLSIAKHKCMSYAREDGVSVIFKSCVDSGAE